MFKRTATIVLITFISIAVFSQERVRIDINPSRQTNKYVEEVKEISNGIVISESISSIEFVEKETKEGTYLEIFSNKLTKSFDKGKPNLPLISRLIEIPLNKKPLIKVLSYDEQIVKLKDYSLLKEIMPAQPSLSKSDDPEKVPFYKNKDIYDRNEFFKNELVKFEDRGFLRNKHIGYVEISPFEYNPIENTLKVINNIEVEIIFVDDFTHKPVNPNNLASPYFENIPLSTINEITSTKALISGPVKYVIVADRMFEESLQTFIEWKTLKGFNVVEAYTDESNVGNTTTSIKAYLKDLYENPVDGISPTFILFVGDVNQIPAFSASGHVTDLYYCEYTDDKLPEVFYGRFSAETVEELQPQIDKTLEVEKYLMPDPSYLDNVVLVAGVDGTYAPTYGNGFVNYATQYYINSENGINALSYLYPESGSSDEEIRSEISNGVALANYTAHCGPSGWSDPNFSTSHIATMTNEHMYPLMIGNCCESNRFETNDCFGETLLKTPGKGAVGYIGGSNETLWSEDYWWGVGLGSISANPTYEDTELGSYDRMFHSNGEVKDDWYITQGQMIVAGNLAVEASTSSNKAYYWEIYHLMGDPSLTPYVSVPALLTASYNSIIIKGNSRYQVDAEDNAYVALSFNGVLLDAKLVDETGQVELSFESLENEGILDLVITKQNRQPIIDQITIIPANTPYVVLDYYNIIDSLENNNSEVDIDEVVVLDIQLENLADNYDAYNVIANISSTDTNFTITDNTESFGTILKADTSLIDTAFTFKTKGKFADQQVIYIDLEILWEDIDTVEYNWNKTIRLNVNAPEIEIGEVLIDDETGNNNGILDPGETADISLVVSNVGSASISNINGIISILEGESHLTLNNTESAAIILDAQSIDTLKFNATANSESPISTSVFVLFEINDQTYNYYSKSESKEINIGIIPEIRITDEDTLINSLAYFYDSGGALENYSNHEDDTITLSPKATNEYLVANFISFSVEQNNNNGGCYDYLEIYDGADTSTTLIGSYCNSNTPSSEVVSTSESGALTFVFNSDYSETRTGWEVEIRSFIGSDYQLTVHGKDGLLEDAIVEFNGKTDTTDVDGIANFYNIPEGINYSVRITADGYDVFEKTIDVFENITEEIYLGESEYNVEFLLSDEENPCINGEITFDGKTQSTFEGSTIFAGVNYGLNKEYSTNVFGHLDSIASLDVTRDLTENILLKSIKHNIEFVISNGTDLLDTVSVEFDKRSILTGTDGIALFEDVNRDTMLVYTVRRSDYKNIVDTMDVLRDSTVNLTMESGIALFNVKFVVLKETAPVYNVQVILGSDTLYTNGDGIVVFENLEETDNIPYKITKIHFNDVEGFVSVLGKNVQIQEDLSYKSYEIKFILDDGTDPLEGVGVNFAGENRTSNNNGECIFNFTYSLNKFYNISKDGYTSVIKMTNIDENKTIVESLSLIAYDVTFETFDADSLFVENAEVEFYGATQHTESDGKTIFEKIVPGENISFTIRKEGYWDYDSTITVLNSDILFSARLSSTTGVDLVIERDIKIYPNPSTGIFNLEISNNEDNTFIVKVFDVIGSVIYTKKIDSNIDINEQIDITNKAKGIYFLTVESESKSIICKRIITK